MLFDVVSVGPTVWTASDWGSSRRRKGTVPQGGGWVDCGVECGEKAWKGGRKETRSAAGRGEFNLPMQAESP